MNSSTFQFLRRPVARDLVAVWLTAGLMLQTATAAAPDWWAVRGVYKAGAAADDYAVANVGQLKHVASRAAAEMNATLAGGAGVQINDFVASWLASAPQRDDYAAVTAGQLKKIARMFYDRLAGAGAAAVYPWGGPQPADDHSIVNTGQVKRVFSFPVDSNGNTLPDLWEMLMFGHLGESLNTDFDGDGLNNLQEWSFGTSAKNQDSDDDGYRDGDEHALGADPNKADSVPQPELVFFHRTAASAAWKTGFAPFTGSSNLSYTTKTTVTNLSQMVNDHGSVENPQQTWTYERHWSSASTTTEAWARGVGTMYQADSFTGLWNDDFSANYDWRDELRTESVNTNTVGETHTKWHSTQVTAPGDFDTRSSGNWSVKQQADGAPVTGTWDVRSSEYPHSADPAFPSPSFTTTAAVRTTTWAQDEPYGTSGNGHASGGGTQVETLSGVIPDGAMVSALAGDFGLAEAWPPTFDGSGDGTSQLTLLSGYSASGTATQYYYKLEWPEGTPERVKQTGNYPRSYLIQENYRSDDLSVQKKDYKHITLKPGESSAPQLLSAITFDSTRSGLAWVGPDDLLPVEINSRDRAVEGFIPNIDPSKPLKVKFTAANKTFGPYEIPTSGSSNDVYVYDSEDAVFSDEEAAKWKNHTLPEKAWKQEVNFVREGNGVRFSTVSDSLGEFKVTLYSGNSEVGPVTHQLTEDKDFARLITAVHGMVSGQDPPKIKAWDEDPDPFDGDDVILAAPPAELPLANLGDIAAGAPASVAAAFTDLSVLRTKDGFNQFVNLVRERTTETEWIAFGQLLTAKGATPTLAAPPPGMAPAAAAAANGGSWWPSWGSDKQEPRVDMQLPPELSNRGLVAKCLIYWVKKLIVAQVATGEGVVFGLWDGVVSDVEGVGAVLKAPVDLIDKLRDPWGAAAEIYHSFKAIKELGWDGVKQKVIDMFNAFLSEQEGRLDQVLGDQCKDPVYFGAYMGGYLTGYVGEQVAGALLTAGTIKAGWVGKAIREGAAVVKSIQKLSDPLHHFSKSFAKVRSRYTRTADELRAMRAAAQKCGPDGFCLVAGTLVLMGDHSFKRVDDIMPGDLVWADDPTDDKPAGPTRVQFQTASFTLDPILIEWDRDGDGKPDGSVTASPVHPFYVVGTGWVDADHLQAGQRMFDEQGRTTTITGIGIVPGRAATYDIGLDQVHGFFAGATPQSFTLTHNANHDVNPYWKQAEFIPGRVPPTRYEKHHFFYDAWMAVHYDGLYRKGRLDTSFPTLHLTPEDHLAMHQYANNYFQTRFGVNANLMTSQHWAQVSVEEMEKLALNMGAVVGIPKSKMEEVMNKQNQWFFKKMKKVFGCIRQ